MKVKTDLIGSITASPIMIMYVKAFKIYVIAFIGNMIKCLTSHRPVISIRVSVLILKIICW